MTPAVPVRPLVPAAIAAKAGEGAPAVKPTLKKETVRIDVPAKTAVPQATVKIQQTQPLVRAPEAQVRTLAVPTTTAMDPDYAGSTKEEPMMMIVSIVAAVLAAASFAVQLITFLAP